MTTQIWLWDAAGATYQLDFVTGPDDRRWIRNRVFAAAEEDASAALRGPARPVHAGLPPAPLGPSPLDAFVRFRAP